MASNQVSTMHKFFLLLLLSKHVAGTGQPYYFKDRHLERHSTKFSLPVSVFLLSPNVEVRVKGPELSRGWVITTDKDGKQRFETHFIVRPKRHVKAWYKLCSKPVDSHDTEWICSRKWMAYPVIQEDGSITASSWDYRPLRCELNCTECETIVIGVQREDKGTELRHGNGQHMFRLVRSESLFVHAALDLDETREIIHVERESEPQKVTVTEKTTTVIGEEVCVKEAIIGGIIHAIVCVVTVACICYTFLRFTNTPVVLSAVFAATVPAIESSGSISSTELFTSFDKEIQWANESIFGCNDGSSVASFPVYIPADGQYQLCKQERKFGDWNCDALRHYFKNEKAINLGLSKITPWKATQPFHPEYHHAVVVIGILNEDGQRIRSGVRQCMRTFQNSTTMRSYLQNHQKVFSHVYDIPSSEIVYHDSSTPNAPNETIVEEKKVIIKKSDYDPIRDGVIGGLINGLAVSIVIVSISWLYKRRLPAS